MGTSRVLKIGYKTDLDEVGNFIIRSVKDPDGTGADQLTDTLVTDLCTAMLTNKAMFSKAPAVIESAEVITTITDECDVSSVNSGA